MEERVKRSEAIEREAWGELYRRASPGLQRSLGLRVEERGEMTFLSASRADHLLLNRAIGLASAEATPGAVRHYEALGIARYWIHVGSQYRHSEVARALRARGVVPYPRSWMKFARRAAPEESTDCAFVVRAAIAEDAPRIAEISAPAFDMPEKAGAIFATAIGAPGWHYFVAERGTRVVAASALYVRGQDALLVFAATAPEARRKGCQRGLMAARLERAEQLGCRHTFTETGLPVEGEPSSSYRNMLRAGFDELYVRDNFAPEGTRWQSHPSSGGIARSSVSPKPSRTPPKAAGPFGT